MTLYRCACRHCDAAEEELRKLAPRYGATLEVQSVDSQERLRGFAGWRTPIVTVNGVELTHYKVDARKWEEALQKKTDAEPSSLLGCVVDMCCYFQRGARPSAHEACAKECFAAGGPMGIATLDGRVFLALPDKRDPRAFERLKESPEREVRVVGDIRMRDGVLGVVVSRVEEP